MTPKLPCAALHKIDARGPESGETSAFEWKTGKAEQRVFDEQEVFNMASAFANRFELPLFPPTFSS